jgi:hypothetical protein
MATLYLQLTPLEVVVEKAAEDAGVDGAEDAAGVIFPVAVAIFVDEMYVLKIVGRCEVARAVAEKALRQYWYENGSVVITD